MSVTSVVAHNNNSNNNNNINDNSFDRLPEVAVELIFQFFNPIEILSNRRVCRYFHEHLNGVIHISCIVPPTTTANNGPSQQQQQQQQQDQSVDRDTNEEDDPPVPSNATTTTTTTITTEIPSLDDPSIYYNPIGQVTIRGKRDIIKTRAGKMKRNEKKGGGDSCCNCSCCVVGSEDSNNMGSTILISRSCRADDNNDKKRRWESDIRVKGQLPEPNVLPDQSDLWLETLQPSVAWTTGRNGVALHLEREINGTVDDVIDGGARGRRQPDDDQREYATASSSSSPPSSSTTSPLFSYYQSLDLSMSICTISRTTQSTVLPHSAIRGAITGSSRRLSVPHPRRTRPHPDRQLILDDSSRRSSIADRYYNGGGGAAGGVVPIISVVRTKPLLKRILCRLDLSSLRHLDSCSVRGCGNLKTMYLPPSLVALDASCCGVLNKISFPFGQRVPCHALNLKGCRSLEPSTSTSLFGNVTADVMRHVRELDMSSTNRLGKDVMAHALSLVHELESLSLRYGATDTALSGLAQSVACKRSVRYIDVSFSPSLSDRPCWVIVETSPRLERFNLRACSNVSAVVYNTIPVTLFRRMNTTTDRTTDVEEDIGGISSDETNHNNKTEVTANDDTPGAGSSTRKGDNIFFFTS